MGSPTGEEGRNDDEVQHEVTITNDFHLGAYEVTQSQYKKIMGNNPSQFQGEKADFNEDLPVESVSWEDAVEFCNIINIVLEYFFLCFLYGLYM